MASRTEIGAMRKALRIARYGKGNTFPNPMVGAVILDSHGNHAGDGFHRRCGAPHAEAVAISSAGDAASGGTLVVTLEPCCHHGRTGPCTEIIKRSGISRVVVAMEDPDPRVSGEGIRQLEQAGIQVETGLLSEEAAALNRVYLHYLETSRSWVTLKIALSLDGRIAAADGSSRWISCEESRRRVHRMRTMVQAVMTGGATVRRDDPMLTVREVDVPPGGQPARIVVSSRCDFGGSRKVFQGKGRVILAVPGDGAASVPSEIKDRSNVEIWEFPAETGSGGIDLGALLERTAEEGMGEILCEAGPLLSSRLIGNRLVNSVSVFTSPMILGGEGIPAFDELGIGSMKEAIGLKNVTSRRSGSDFLTEGEIVYGSD